MDPVPNNRHHWVAYNWRVAVNCTKQKSKGHVEFWLNHKLDSGSAKLPKKMRVVIL